MMKIFETHAHYDDEAFREDREALFDEMFANDIDTIINVGASFAGCEQSVALADSHEKIYAAVGLHPEDVEELTEARMAWLKKTASENEKVLAIGEIGLDYHYPEPAKEIQQQWFRRQLNLAADVKKPVIIHSREACQDTLACMRAEHAEQIGGVIHCYSYSKEAAQEFLKMGCTVFPSEADYITFRLPQEKTGFLLKERLLEGKILIRSCANYRNMPPDCYRIAVKQHADNEELVRQVWRILIQ